jgi:hypothetical protein
MLAEALNISEVFKIGYAKAAQAKVRGVQGTAKVPAEGAPLRALGVKKAAEKKGKPLVGNIPERPADTMDTLLD